MTGTKTRLAAATGALSLLFLHCAAAASFLGERQARDKAVAFLKGDPYGRTNAQVGRNIKGAEFRQQGPAKACNDVRTAAWEFHVVVVTPDKDQYDNGVIDGYLALDAKTGDFLCANLPMLD